MPWEEDDAGERGIPLCAGNAPLPPIKQLKEDRFLAKRRNALHADHQLWSVFSYHVLGSLVFRVSVTSCSEPSCGSGVESALWTLNGGELIYG